MRGGGEERARGRDEGKGRFAHPGLLGSWALPSCEALWETREALLGKAGQEASGVHTRHHTKTASYPDPVSTGWRHQDQHQGALLHQGNLPFQPASAQFLPWHSCQSLARQGCPGRPFLPFPEERLDGPSGPGHSLHRCSDGRKGKDRGTWVRDGQGEPSRDALSESGARALCPMVLHPHTLPPQTHPCSFALSSGDPIPAIGSEFPPGRGSGRAKPERFPDRRVGGDGGTRRGTICPGCSCNLHPQRGQAPRIQDEKTSSQCQHLCLGMPGEGCQRSRFSVDTSGRPEAHHCHRLHRSLGLNCPYRKGFF